MQSKELKTSPWQVVAWKYLAVFEIANPSNGVRGRVGPPLRLGWTQHLRGVLCTILLLRGQYRAAIEVTKLRSIIYQKIRLWGWGFSMATILLNSPVTEMALLSGQKYSSIDLAGLPNLASMFFGFNNYWAFRFFDGGDTGSNRHKHQLCIQIT